MRIQRDTGCRSRRWVAASLVALGLAASCHGAPGASRPGDEAYVPRTRHKRPDGTPRYTNRLILETSPYLLQHAHNPVDWYPWGDEAFAAARARGVPVFLSIGYSTCHWCHVMEEESFEDEEIAETLNRDFVAIKVDREERPDLDGIYMSAVQAMTGRGGWPMSVWLGHDRKPFYGGTYFPARDGDRGAATGFLTLLGKLKGLWDESPELVADTAGKLARAIATQLEAASAAGGASGPGAEAIRAAVAVYGSRFDETWGGLRGAPKFPSSLPIRLLLRYARRTGDPKPLEMARLTLEKMAAGGMYDHLGGGFHRYSTDERWLVPHFEKMLYDNALLVLAYLEAAQALAAPGQASSGDAAVLERVARETLEWADREMSAPGGGFRCATDADSLTPEGHREEGYCFTWTPGELAAALGEADAKLVAAYYDVTEAGSLEGRSILHVGRPLEAVAKELGVEPEAARVGLERSRRKLLAVRQARPAPLRDDKVLTAWNGLMISAFARAGLMLGEPGWVARAARAADFLLAKLRRDGRLLRSYMAGEARHTAYLDDYAFLTAGLLDLFEASGQARWLKEAIALDGVLARHYEDVERGGFFLTSDDHEALLAREKPSYDGAEPSGNSVAVMNLLRLHQITTQERYRLRAVRALRAFGALLGRAPAALPELLLALEFHLDTPKQIVIVTPAGGADPRRQARSFLERLERAFLPNRTLAVVAQGASRDALARLVPLVMDKVAQRGKVTAYVCEDRVCKLPTTDPERFARLIAETRPLEAEKAPGGAREDR